MHSPTDFMRNWKNHVNVTGFSCVPTGSLLQNSTGQTQQGRQTVTVSGRQGVSAALDTTRQSEPGVSSSSRLMCAASVEVDSKGERQPDQNLSPVSPLGDAEYDAYLRLSAGQQVQLVT